MAWEIIHTGKEAGNALLPCLVLFDEKLALVRFDASIAIDKKQALLANV
jgi:hypothetical protein